MNRFGADRLRTLGLLALAILAAATAAAESGDTDEETAGVEWFWFPFPIHSPETDWALTLSAIAGFSIAEGPPSNLIASASYSQNDQKSVSADAEVNVGSDWRVGGRIALQDWPTHYYGLGDNTRTEDEEFYDARNAELTARVQRAVGERFWVGPRIVWRDHGVDAFDPGGLLDLQGPLGIDGVKVGGAGVLATFDTRDDLNVPDSGVLVETALTFFGGAFGSDLTFRRFSLDARQFIAVRRGWVLAIHQYVETTSGRVPFQELPRLGESAPPSRLRGHITGRFRDRHAISLQSELRFPIRGRLSGVVFGGAGDVSNRLSDFSIGDLKWTGGAGLRFRALREQRINLRLDVARGSDETGVYFSVLEAF